ncbi:MAG: hypothetical protein Phyf2KO_07220 [Phycisphaerales bacterium]
MPVDSTGDNPEAPERAGTGGFNAIVGNPPFLSQLSSATALNRGYAAIIKQRIGKAASAYTDTSALFLADALSKLLPAGRVSFILPQSVLASRDAAALRSRILDCHTLEHLWVSGEQAFEQTLVSTCAPIVHQTRLQDAAINHSYSLAFRESESGTDAAETQETGTWSCVAADARGLPRVIPVAGGKLNEIATATADFRDEYYGLAGFIVDMQIADEHLFPKLITTSMIDPAHNGWGKRSFRILKEKWGFPRIDRDRMRISGTLSGWMDTRLVSKVLVATQSHVIEAVVDDEGACLPCMPVISACPKPEVDLWHLASAVSSPVACLHAVRHYSGTAMTPDAIKLSAKQLLTLPIPLPCESWDSAADRFRAASECNHSDEKLDHLVRAGSDMCTAFGIGDPHLNELLAWWERRLKKGHAQVMKQKWRRLG